MQITAWSHVKNSCLSEPKKNQCINGFVKKVINSVKKKKLYFYFLIYRRKEALTVWQR